MYVNLPEFFFNSANILLILSLNVFLVPGSIPSAEVGKKQKRDAEDKKEAEKPKRTRVEIGILTLFPYLTLNHYPLVNLI